MRNGPSVPCVYCGSTLNATHDHVPPKNLFQKPFPTGLITVPSCEECNRSFSKDDEYFRVVLVWHPKIFSNPHAQTALDSALRSLRRISATWFRETLLSAIHRVPRRSRSGLILSLAHEIQIDMVRVIKTIDRITRALYYHHIGHRVPSGHVVAPVYLRGLRGPRKSDDEVEKENDLLKSIYDRPEHRIGGTTFCYKYGEMQHNPEVVIWQLQFFYEVAFLSLVLPGNMLDNIIGIDSGSK